MHRIFARKEDLIQVGELRITWTLLVSSSGFVLLAVTSWLAVTVRYDVCVFIRNIHVTSHVS